VQPGDLLYPIGICDQVLYVPSRMRVQQIIPVGDDRALLQEYFAQYGAWRFLVPTCTTKVVLGVAETGILLDRPLPGEILQRLTYRPRRGPRRSVTSAKTAASSTRSACRASTGWPSPPPPTWKPSRPDRQARRFPCPSHASTTTSPQARTRVSGVRAGRAAADIRGYCAR